MIKHQLPQSLAAGPCKTFDALKAHPIACKSLQATASAKRMATMLAILFQEATPIGTERKVVLRESTPHDGGIDILVDGNTVVVVNPSGAPHALHDIAFMP